MASVSHLVKRCAACAADLPMTVSLGVATMMPGGNVGHCQSMAIAQADQALYLAKENGRNCVVAYWQR